MARNLYLTGLEELEESMRTISDVDEKKLLTVKRTIVQLLHQDETASPPFRRFGVRSTDLVRRALREAVREELETTDAAICRIQETVFDDPSPQYDAMNTVLERYQLFVESVVGSDSNSD
jgi:hypothetical protein